MTLQVGVNRKISFVQAINEAMREEMRRDPRVILIGENVRIGVFGTTRGLVEEFGQERVLDTPISEAGFIGTAAGAALVGRRPIVDLLFVNFLFVAMDQVVNEIAKLRYMTGGQARLPLVIRGATGCIGSAAAQHSELVHAKLMNSPGLKVVFPTTPYDAKGLFKSAVRSDDPVVFLEHLKLLSTTGEVPEQEYTLPFGQAAVRREGRDVTIVAIGGMVPLALEAAVTLTERGVEAEVIDPRTIVPLDRQAILDSVAKTGRLVIVDEGNISCSVASEIAAVVAEKGFRSLRGPIRRVCTPDVPIPFSPPLEKFVLPSTERIVVAALELCSFCS